MESFTIDSPSEFEYYKLTISEASESKVMLIYGQSFG